MARGPTDWLVAGARLPQSVIEKGLYVCGNEVMLLASYRLVHYLQTQVYAFKYHLNTA